MKHQYFYIDKAKIKEPTPNKFSEIFFLVSVYIQT
jgi:hypothetical protein